MTRSCVLVLTFLLAFAGTCCADERANDEIPVWVEALRSDDYAVREWATQNLIASGAEAISPLANELETYDVEAAIRGFSILRHLASQEDASALVAEAAIRRLAENQATANSRRAAKVLSAIEANKPSRAKRILARLGAELGSSTARFGDGNVTLGENWKGSVEDLRYLGWLPYRRMVVKLSGSQVTNEWLEMLTELPNLYALYIYDASINDDGMVSVEQMPLLIELRLFYCDVSNKCLKHFGGVGSLWAFGTQMTKVECERLRVERPELIVRFGLGGFLGIGGQNYDQPDPGNPKGEPIKGVHITVVNPNEAANKADIRPDDIILEYDGQAVTQFLPINQLPTGRVPAIQPMPRNGDAQETDDGIALSQLIGKNRAGEKVRVKILRNGEYIVKEVELGKWR